MCMQRGEFCPSVVAILILVSRTFGRNKEHTAGLIPLLRKWTDICEIYLSLYNKAES